MEISRERILVGFGACGAWLLARRNRRLYDSPRVAVELGPMVAKAETCPEQVDRGVFSIHGARARLPPCPTRRAAVRGSRGARRCSRPRGSRPPRETADMQSMAIRCMPNATSAPGANEVNCSKGAGSDAGGEAMTNISRWEGGYKLRATRARSY